MPNIRPFKAYVYSEKLRKDIGNLISPPYDVISSDSFRNLKNLNPYQSVRLALADDANDPERYMKMKSLFSSWKKEGALEAYKEPAFYLIEDDFSSDVQKSRRIGFVALLEVSPFEKKEILPHEFTLSGPKKDRLDLLRTMRAEISQIFLCYKDSELTLEKLHEQKSSSSPILEGLDTTGVYRKVWAISDSKEVESLQSLIKNREALIADGHHRYETAVSFREEAPYVQVYLTNLNTPGFSIQPIHRLFSLPESLQAESFLKSLSESFQITEWKKPVSVEALRNISKANAGKDLGLFCSISETKQNYLLTRKRKSADDCEIFSIHADIFEKVLGWNVKELAKGSIHYEHETKDYLSRLNSIPRGVGLFLPPTDLDLVMRLAERGERMPQKSTFFYPKLASGLINFDLDKY